MIFATKKCPRCNGSHEDLHTRQFTQPMTVPGLNYIWTMWTMCPTTNEPVLLGEGKVEQCFPQLFKPSPHGDN